MGHIFLVRHGQTAWNKARIFRGRTDVRLNEQGRLEAQAAAQALRDVPLEYVFTSPLSRSRETAEIVAAVHDAAVRAEPAFTDIDYGEWTEYWDVEARRKFKEQYRLWETAPHRMHFPGGESLQEVRARAVPRFREIAVAYRRNTIALVSHRVVLKLILCDIKGLDNSHFWKVQLDTGAIADIESESGRLRLVVENDTRHLQSLASHDSLDF